jgi:hypothetical protein
VRRAAHICLCKKRSTRLKHNANDLRAGAVLRLTVDGEAYSQLARLQSISVKNVERKVSVLSDMTPFQVREETRHVFPTRADHLDNSLVGDWKPDAGLESVRLISFSPQSRSILASFSPVVAQNNNVWLRRRWRRGRHCPASAGNGECVRPLR